ncbi:hypothetical protein FQA39_LY10687 [Lamprigera yunnana]|nr:hypothetical protein FQA39_LY10687 [Lamprigera yunnana]
MANTSTGEIPVNIFYCKQTKKRVLFETEEVHIADEDIDFNDDKNILFDLPEGTESEIENLNLESDYDSEDDLPLSHLLKKKKIP